MVNSKKKILVVGPAWVGDMVMAQTLFKLLQAQNAVQIDVLAPDWSRPLLERMPEVNQAIALPIKHREFGLKTRLKIAKQLRNAEYQQAILLPNSYKSALVPFLAKIPVRTGWLGEFRWLLLNDVRYLNKNKLPLMIERFMALGLTAKQKQTSYREFRPQLQISPSNVAQAVNKYDLKPQLKPVLILCPGAEFGPAKRWPEQHYATIAKEKIKQGWQVWLLGSTNDKNVTAAIQKLTDDQCIDLAGKTNLAEAIDLLSLANMVVSNDSGLMHIAAALNRPLVVVYGSSSPKFTPPLNDRVKIIALDLACSPCFKRECPLTHLNCLKQLTPEQVLQGISELQQQAE